LKFYDEIGLPKTLGDLGLGEISLSELWGAAEVACHSNSDIHRLPFRVIPEQLVAAMVSTTVPQEPEKQNLVSKPEMFDKRL
ncbi:MAG: glycerol dehydrogenase, partial [Okeania sp. SIO4D6]|nr:glycerol dehydrogenase [Okeania sp. SIO4D6]